MNAIEPTLWDKTNPDDDAQPAEIVYAFIRALIQRYHAVEQAAGPKPLDDETLAQRLAQLRLAEAAIRYVADHRPPQIAVMGPTQTGKSTLVNVLAAAPVADVSPLAGYTVHPQGFWFTGETKEQPPIPEPWEADLFPDWRRCTPEELTRSQDDLDRYSLSRINAPTSDDTNAPPRGVIWDTPDFDSLAARTYQRGVLETAALADAHLFVLSKEKYADLSVWRMLKLLQPLNRPLALCLNKLTPDAADAILASLKTRLREIGGAYENAPIVSLAYLPASTSAVESQPEAADVRRRIAAEFDASRRSDRAAGACRLVKHHWPDWTAPVRGEQEALNEWRDLINAGLESAAVSYERDFLDHPQRYDTFRRATVELLHLLEVPGFADAVSQIRNVLSWPARKLFAARQTWRLKRFNLSVLPRGLGAEEVVLNELVEKLLTSLERDAVRRSDPASPAGRIWRLIARRLEQQSTGLRQCLAAAAKSQRDDFKPVIHETADRLYEALRKKPALLNALRAARVTADLAAVGLAVKTAGLGLNDLLFAPAMFGLTSMLTEGALGTYMTHIAADLKKRQLAHVKANLFDGAFNAAFDALTDDLKDEGVFGLSEQRLNDAERALEQWERAANE